MMILRPCIVILGLLCMPLRAADLAPFVLPWDDDAAGSTDLRGTLEKPAGKFGFVRVAGGHLYAGPERLRLFGVNLTAGACFPDQPSADRIAGRIAKFGLNAVRFHFLDAQWGEPRLIRYETGDWQNWDAQNLDRLDYFIAQLEKRGIYINLNLLVGRRFGVRDGVDPAIQKLDWKAAHAVGFFHAPHRQAQKDYARRLLTHRNPYTQCAYNEDPAVALIEINNESGLLHTWMDGGFNALPEPFAGDLNRQWNAWLAAKYADPAALDRAWGVRDEPLGTELLVNGGWTNGWAGWRLEQHSGAVAQAAVTNGQAVVAVRKTGQADWHVQINQRIGAVRKDQLYTLTINAAADRQRIVKLTVMQDSGRWNSLGLERAVTLTPEMTSCTFRFIVDEDADIARLNIGGLNQEGATFRFGAVSLRRGGAIGPSPGESLAKRNLSNLSAADPATLLPGRRRDWIQFLWETERRYWTDMRQFLKTELGVKVPVVGTIAGTSTPNLQSDFDLSDSHAYWEHPDFHGKAWDRNDWTVKNISMVDHPDRATVISLAGRRVSGKPHMVSEYNHPAPNTHAGEGPLFVAAFGALQDWDAIFLYTYSHGEAATTAGRIPDFFDIGQHPTTMANALVASLLFRRADVHPAPSVLRIPMTSEAERQHITAKGHAWRVFDAAQLGVDMQSVIDQRVELDLTGAANSSASAPLDHPELSWRLPAPEQGLFEIRSPRTKGFIGHADGQAVDLGDGVQLRDTKTLNGWCTVMLTLLDGASFTNHPRRALLVATAYAENTDMGWKSANKDSVGANWGRPPSLIEPVASVLRLANTGALPTLYPLDERGQRGTGVGFSSAGAGDLQVAIGAPHRTLWYEIEWPATR